MKFYCIGNPIDIVKTKHSASFWDNMHVIGTPIGGVIKITPAIMHNAFNASQELTLCKNLADAKLLRLARIKTRSADVDESLLVGAIAAGFPLQDYVIYEVEIDDKVSQTLAFSKVNEASIEVLKKILAPEFHVQFATHKYNSSILPAADFCQVAKEIVSPKLVNCHYISWAEGTEVSVNDQGYGCTIS